MKLADIVAGKVVIHNDMLVIPAFKKIWDADNPTKELATINNPVPPNVTALDKLDILLISNGIDANTTRNILPTTVILVSVPFK